MPRLEIPLNKDLEMGLIGVSDVISMLFVFSGKGELRA
jgi:hypothetical protein